MQLPFGRGLSTASGLFKICCKHRQRAVVSQARCCTLCRALHRASPGPRDPSHTAGWSIL